MAIGVGVKTELQLASAEFFNKLSMTILPEPSSKRAASSKALEISDETIQHFYSLFDKLQKGYFDEKTFEPTNPLHRTFESILQSDSAIDPNVKKLCLALYDSYIKYCSQVIHDFKVDQAFNQGMHAETSRRDVEEKFANFLSNITSQGIEIFPVDSLKLVLSTLEDTKKNLSARKPVEASAMHVILDYVQRESKQPKLIQAASELKQSMNNAAQLVQVKLEDSTSLKSTKAQKQKIALRMKLFGKSEKIEPKIDNKDDKKFTP